MIALTSPFAPHIARLLAHQRALGVAYHRERAFFAEFERLTVGWPDDVLSEALVRKYLAAQTDGGRPHRLTVIRALARFLALEDPRTFIPPLRFLGIRRRRPPVIRVLSREEASRFLLACDVLPDTTSCPRGLVRSTALRVLLLTGLRRGEVLALHDEDVDLLEHVITVQCGKFGKPRFVPVHSDLANRLRRCREAVVTRIGARQPGDPFFPGSDGRRPIRPTSLYKTFRAVLDLARIPHLGRGRGPRLHDLRHSFAVLKLLSWYEAGADLGAKLPLLSTYLGHVGLASSQHYLHMTEDLVGTVITRQRQAFGDVITGAAQ
jgi:integrase/recombinase XerD